MSCLSTENSSSTLGLYVSYPTMSDVHVFLSPSDLPPRVLFSTLHDHASLLPLHLSAMPSADRWAFL